MQQKTFEFSPFFVLEQCFFRHLFYHLPSPRALHAISAHPERMTIDPRNLEIFRISSHTHNDDVDGIMMISFHPDPKSPVGYLISIHQIVSSFTAKFVIMI